MEALASQFDVAVRISASQPRRLAATSSARPCALGASSLLSPLPPQLSRAVSASPAPCAAPRRPLPLAPRAQVAEGAEADEVEGAALARKYPPFAAFRIHGTGRRKTAVARVALIEGDGNFLVNDIPLSDYFQDQALLIQAVKLPLSSLGYSSKYDVVVKAHGGGLSAQAQAMMLGIARALVKANETNKPPLKAQGMLTRDSRAVERKKYGLKKARKAPQFSKR